MSLSSEDASKQLVAIRQRNDDRLAQQGKGNAAVAFAKDVKQSLLFQYDWSELLAAAPLCLSMIGSCYVAATCPEASGLSLEDCKPAKGFEHIKHPELRACLTQISDVGRFCFIDAEKNMDLIASQSTSIGTWLGQVGQYLSYLPAPDAAMNLRKKLDLIKEGSDNALRYTLQIETSFKGWLALVCEVHQVTVAKEEKTGIEQRDGANELDSLGIESELTQTSLSHAEDSAKLMKENMDSAKKAFEKAADEIPSPLEQVGIQFVSGLAQTATTVIGAGLPMLMGRMGAPVPGAAPTKGSGKKGSRSGRNVSSQVDINVTDGSDPAYATAGQVAPWVTVLVTYLGAGADKTVDWEHLNPPPAPANSKTKSSGGITFLATNLRFALNNTQWTAGKASGELKDVLSRIVGAVEEIKAEIAKDKSSLMAEKADATSPLVQKWQKVMVDGQVVVTQLQATGASLPGSAPGSAPFMRGLKPGSQAPQDTSGVNAALDSAHQKAQITQAAYSASQDNYMKAVERRTAVETQLARIKAELGKLQGNQIKLAQIKKILRQCIGMIIQMKQQITNLVRFFSALSAMVEHVVKTKVREFLEEVDTAKDILIANISLSDLCRQELYTTTLMCQAYFSLFSTIANMYKKISNEHIMPGVSLCDEIGKSQEDSSVTERKMRDLNEFTDRAQKAVRDEVSKAQNDITKTLEDRVSAAGAETRLLPSPSPVVAKAIESGKSTVTGAVADSIDNTENPIVFADAIVSTDDI